MHLKFFYFSSIIFLSLSLAGFGQHNGVHKCYTSEMEALNEARYPEWKAERKQFENDVHQELLKLKLSKQKKTASTVLKVPVVVHVIYWNSAENIPDQQVFDQIEVLNEDFGRTNADAINTPLIYNSIASNTEIQFCLAIRDPNGESTNGINRIKSPKPSLTYPADDAYLKALSYWPSDQYLNIWVCNLKESSQTFKILGYAQFPSNSSLSGLSPEQGPETTDGVVINYTVFGKNSSTGGNYDLGRTTTHEVGHWFGLLHTWGDGDCSVDDNCTDTPNCDGDFYAGLPACTAPIQCGGRRMIENYMDYSDDACMNLYTADQTMRMQTTNTISPRRLALQNSKGCCDTCVFPKEVDLNIYPNPTQGSTTFTLESKTPTVVSLKIYDRTGKFMYEEESAGVRIYKKTLDFSHWTDGLYLVVVKAGDRKFVRKIMIIK